MFDKLQADYQRFLEVDAALADPATAVDPARVAALAKERGTLAKVANPYGRYLELGRQLAEARALPWPDDLVLVLVSPAFELATASSRQVLPRAFTLAETLAFAENLAGFVHAVDSGDRELLSRCLRDVLTEPHRAPLVPGFRAAQAAALDRGALG